MKGVIISFTANGERLGEKVSKALKELGWNADTFVKSKYVKSSQAHPVTMSLNQWVEPLWEETEAIVFVGATGIAVRAIAPFIKSKKTDPAVLCMDEKGTFCIPLLSGHLGGANELAEKLCDLTGALPVITTATDLNECFAVDLFAKKQGIEIRDMKEAKEISAALLSGKKRITAGIGCRKGTSAKEVKAALIEVCSRNRIPIECIKQLASIELKKEEAGIIETAREFQIPFITFSAEELSEVPGEYTASLFVQSVTGVENVCERSAVLGSSYGILIQKKTAVGPVTVALALKEEETNEE
jgi:cobalt-precorrin 5A hydrolase